MPSVTVEIRKPSDLWPLMEMPKCPTGCRKCCGPVPLHPEEARALGLPEGTQATPWKQDGSYECIFLGPDGCTKYDVRPMVCRLFGTSKGGINRCHILAEAGVEAPMMNEVSEGLSEIYFLLLQMAGFLAVPTDAAEAIRLHDVRAGMTTQEDAEKQKQFFAELREAARKERHESGSRQF